MNMDDEQFKQLASIVFSQNKIITGLSGIVSGVIENEVENGLWPDKGANLLRSNLEQLSASLVALEAECSMTQKHLGLD
jgi:hypothetical protein